MQPKSAFREASLVGLAALSRGSMNTLPSLRFASIHNVAGK